MLWRYSSLSLIVGTIVMKISLVTNNMGISDKSRFHHHILSLILGLPVVRRGALTPPPPPNLAPPRWRWRRGRAPPPDQAPPRSDTATGELGHHAPSALEEGAGPPRCRRHRDRARTRAPGSEPAGGREGASGRLRPASRVGGREEGVGLAQ
jgi:hypothetical protein